MTDLKKRKRNETYTNYIPTYTVPPINQKELKGLVIDILIKESFKPPFDSFSLFRYIKKIFRNVDYSTYVFSKLKINEVVRDLIDSRIVNVEEMFINMKRCYYIKAVDIDKLKNYHNNLVDCEISYDFDKYLEKAKMITADCLKETTYEYDTDDVIVNALYDFDHNHIVYKRQRMEQSEVDGEDSVDGNEDQDNDDQNFVNSILFAPTVKQILNSSHFSGSNYITSNTSVLEKMQSKYSSVLRPFCQYGTTTECSKKNKGVLCSNVHFKPIIKSHTDVNLGDCSYLDTCRHMEICKFVHYQIEDEGLIPSNRKELVLSGDLEVLDSQWVNCDIRYFDYSILGKFDVIMSTLR